MSGANSQASNTVAAASPKAADLLASVQKPFIKSDIPVFREGDTVRVYAKIVEGTKERIQLFEGIVIRRRRGVGLNGTFTVRKISYNVGVERTFLVHSPRIDKIEVINRGIVRRARLFYLRPLRGKAARIKSHLHGGLEESAPETTPTEPAAE